MISKYIKIVLFFFIPAIGPLACVSLVTAATLQVPSPSYPTIQSAINAAGTGDTVDVAAGTYAGSGNWDIDFNGKAITVQCTASEPETCTIDCSGLARHRGFYFHSGEGPGSILDGFTITGGKANQGGAIWCVSASPTITNCNFTSNESIISDGGAIYCSNASPTISNCEFSNNNSPYNGGAIYCTGSTPNITGCTFKDNEAAIYGGAIFFEATSDATITGSSFTNNLAKYGAGIACKSSSPVISNITFETNTASYFGGGIYLEGSSPEISLCTLTGNSATRNGGGVYCEAASAPTITDCEFTTNSSPGPVFGQGGGIYSTHSSPMISECDLIGNTALSGAGIYSDDSDMTVEYCTISKNIAGLANGNYGGGLYLDFNLPTIRFNTISANQAYDGGGIYCYSTLAAIYKNTIKDNIAVRYGGGILADYSLAGINACVIEGNDAQNGGGIKIDGKLTSGTVSVTNSIIINNTADYGAGIEIISSSPTIINNTVFRNTATTEGGGLRYYTPYTTIRPEIINTIFWGDAPDEMRIVDGAILVQYCNIQGGYGGAGGTGNIDSNPLFKDSANNDFHLTSGSPCIDAATSLYAPPEDYDGTARWDDPDTTNTGAGDYPYYDIGAFEYYPVGCSGDWEPDGDVDGSDLAAYITDSAGVSLEDFAVDFGRTDCLGNF